MKKPVAKKRIQIGNNPTRFAVLNERGLYELEPWPMSVDELITAVVKYLKRELPKRAPGQSLMQLRMGSRLLLFGECKILGPTDEDLTPSLDKPLNWNIEAAAHLISRAAAGDGEADKVLRDTNNIFLDRDLLPPRELRNYVRTQFKRSRGNQPTQGRFVLRDREIAYCVKQVLRHSSEEIEATRNVATKDRGGAESACSIVAKAYQKATGKKLTERSINEIWGSLKHDYKPSTITARRNKPNS